MGFKWLESLPCLCPLLHTQLFSHAHARSIPQVLLVSVVIHDTWISKMLGFPFNHSSDFLIPLYDFKYQLLPMTSSILGFNWNLPQQWPLLDIHSIKSQMVFFFFHAFKLIPHWRVLHITRLDCKHELQPCSLYPLPYFLCADPNKNISRRFCLNDACIFSITTKFSVLTNQCLLSQQSNGFTLVDLVSS